MPEITWYQCTDMPNFYSKQGHQSYRDEGSVAIDGILRNPKNTGQRVQVFSAAVRAGLNVDDIVGVFVIEDGTLVPQRFAKGK